MSVRLLSTDLRVVNVRSRIPFRYGIATMTAVPHLFLTAEMEIDGVVSRGVAADHLPPKWFTKDPKSLYRDDVLEMLAVIRNACAVAEEADPEWAKSLFGWWSWLYARQQNWGARAGVPPLLSNFGVSLVERAAIDAYCRVKEISFARALRENRFGIAPGFIHTELDDAKPRDLLPAKPFERITIRHTVGLTDALVDAEVPDDERVDDGLPQSLEACIAAHGLSHFKIKLWGDPRRDADRIERLAELLTRSTHRYAFTLDGNENFNSWDSFRDFWARLTHHPKLAEFLSKLIFVEQPLHRDAALDESTMQALGEWTDRPPIVIDESDATLTSAREALNAGYAGTSHKNCKGVFKGIVNACLLAHRRRMDPQGTYILSAEDLSNIGPVALTQDLAVLATLGVDHAERNGHHYFCGLSMFPDDVQREMLAQHSDLYCQHERGFATLAVRNGAIEISSVIDAPFGYAIAFDAQRYMSMADWSVDVDPNSDQSRARQEAVE